MCISFTVQHQPQGPRAANEQSDLRLSFDFYFQTNYSLLLNHCLLFQKIEKSKMEIPQNIALSNAIDANELRCYEVIWIAHPAVVP